MTKTNKNSPDLQVVTETDSSPPLTLWENRETWLAAGRRLGQRSERDRWALGDWACHGERMHGDLVEAAAEIAIGYGYLRNLSMVARKIDLSRRRDNLSWDHHAAVAALPADIGDDLLDRAAQEGWSRGVLREEAQAASQINRLRSENDRLRRDLARATTDARDEVARLRSRLTGQQRAVRDAARHMVMLAEALPESPVFTGLHGNARLGVARDLRRTADAMASDINAVLARIETVAKQVGGDEPVEDKS